MGIPTGNEIKALASRTIVEDTIIFKADGLTLELSLARWAALGSPNEVQITKLS